MYTDPNTLAGKRSIPPRSVCLKAMRQEMHHVTSLGVSE